MLKIVRRGKKGIFQIVGTVSGYCVRESTGLTSRRHAETKKARREAQLLDELTWGKRHTATFSEAVILYKQKGNSGRFLGLLNEHFGRKRLRDISDLDLADFAALYYPNASPQTLNRQVYTPMIAVWNCARGSGLCGHHDFRRPKQPERKAVRFATDAELAALLPMCEPGLKAAVLLLTFGAARASEVCRVSDEKGDVDWEQQKVLLRKTKSGRPRMIALAPMVHEAMLPLRGNPGSLFGYPDRWRLNRAIEAACRKAGLPVITSHRLGRHAFAARLLRLGHTLKEVQEAGGWSSQSFALIAAAYGHLERAAIDNAIRSADAGLARVLAVARNDAREQQGRSGGA